MRDTTTLDLSRVDPPGDTTGKPSRVSRFFGEIVSAASVLPVAAPQSIRLRCRRRPNRRPCPGRIELMREAAESGGSIHWRCDTCADHGVITNWRDSRWDLSPEIAEGRVVSLSQVRAARAERVYPREQQVYQLAIELIDGPIPLEQLVTRKLAISGEKTLHDLHLLLNEAYDREIDDCYEFMFGAPYELDARRFTCSEAVFDEEHPFTTQQTQIGELDLHPGQVFGYLFDFEAEWIHRLSVTSIADGTCTARVTERVGASPRTDDETQWSSDLCWEEIDDQFPLTELYGPYLAEEAPDPETWLALEDLERVLLVLESHAQSLPQDHPTVKSTLLHAVLHELAETHLAKGDGQARAKLNRQLDRGVNRHKAIHQLGRQLIRAQLDES